MKKLLITAIIAMFITPVVLFSQADKDSDPRLEEQGRSYDRQILELYNSIQRIIAENKLMENKGIKTLPYQTEINFGPDRNNPQYVELVKHIYIMDVFSFQNLQVWEESFLEFILTVKLSVNWKRQSYKELQTQEVESVVVTDPSPNSEATDDVMFTHKHNGKTVIEQKKLADVKNTTTLPLRNEIKIQFMIPNLTILYNNIFFIAESYKEENKSTDSKMSEFIKRAIQY